jgi:probable rRNA maturation factor
MSGITLLVEDPNWRIHRGLQARLKQAAEAARRAARLKGGFCILLADDKTLRRLNRDFRGKNKATNVLSFPGSDGYAGDIAIAHGVTKAEAKAAGKKFADHATHLVVHGVLHLAGYDHERPKDAKVMEPLEVKILKRLGVDDPYKAAA